VLNLGPMRPDAGLHSSDSGGPISSWGATVLKGDDGIWHMWASQFTKHCGVEQWGTNSRTVHATAERPDGAYTVKEVVVPLWSHGAKVTRAPSGEYVMLYIATPPVDPHNTTFQSICDEGSVVYQSDYAHPTGPNGMETWMKWSKSPDGPWSEPVSLQKMYDVEGAWGDADHNLDVTINEDGSVTGLIRRCCDAPSDEKASWIYTVHASDWRNVSSWSVSTSPAFATEPLPNGYEDPHIWADARRPGVYHAVMHDMIGGWHEPRKNNTQLGMHAFSADGGQSWTRTGVAYNWTLDLMDGTVFKCIRRERPNIVLDDAGLPAYLMNSCMYVLDDAGTTKTIVQPIGKSREAHVTLQFKAAALV